MNLFTSLALALICVSQAFSNSTIPFSSNYLGLSPLLAPLYRNVSVGQTWTFTPNNSSHSRRGLGCECFDPDQKCCIPKSSTSATFCVHANETCCGDTMCLPGETCCGEFCCPSETTCNLKLINSGCCPKGSLCGSSPICNDYSSSSCTSVEPLSPNEDREYKFCCPANLPFCRSFSGIGCYASSTAVSTPALYTSKIQAQASSPTPALPNGITQQQGADIQTKTIFLSSGPDGYTGGKLDLLIYGAPGPTSNPEISAPTNPTSTNPTSTVYVVAWPVGSANTSSTLTSSTSSTSSEPQSSESSTEVTSAASETPSSKSHLCFNPLLQTPDTCTTPPATSHTASPTPSGSASTNGEAFAPAGASTVRISSATSLVKHGIWSVAVVGLLSLIFTGSEVL